MGVTPSPKNAKVSEALRLEKHEQQEAVGLLRLCGAKVYSLSQTRNTRQTPGIPDVFAFVPLPSGEIVPLWVEMKRSHRKARSSPEQVVFRLLCKLAGAQHIVGSLREVEAWAVAQGLVAIPAGGGWEILHAQHNVLERRLETFGPLFAAAGREALWSERQGVEALKRRKAAPKRGLPKRGRWR
jgi:hypothetical protein